MSASASRLLCLGVAASVAACSSTSTYRRPDAPVPAAYREATVAAGATWLAAGATTNDRIVADWWRLFGDAELDRLIGEAMQANPTIDEAAANLRQAEAIVRESRAARFPSLGVSGGVQRSGGRRTVDASSYSVSLDADWAPDLFGRVARSVDAATASADARAADLAAARLAVQAELAVNLVSMREADAELALLERTIAGYERSFTIARNRYEAGVVARTDALQAESQLATTQADRAGLVADRARFEHAVAVLAGRAPGDLALAPSPWDARAPAVPIGVPSTLLERRPDIAAAERAVAVADAQIGIERTAYFPSLVLGASLGSNVARLGDLVSASSLLWSLGVSVAQTLFDGGARAARVDGASAARDAAVARYRQTVLVAFQTVEDQLATARQLEAQETLRRTASNAADLTEQQIENRYRSGLVNYTEVVTAQASALAARRALIQVLVNRQVSAITLIRALGGGWQGESP